jgi:hypothetical protein
MILLMFSPKKMVNLTQIIYIPTAVQAEIFSQNIGFSEKREFFLI